MIPSTTSQQKFSHSNSLILIVFRMTVVLGTKNKWRHSEEWEEIQKDEWGSKKPEDDKFDRRDIVMIRLHLFKTSNIFYLVSNTLKI